MARNTLSGPMNARFRSRASVSHSGGADLFVPTWIAHLGIDKGVCVEHAYSRVQCTVACYINREICDCI